MVPMNKLAIMIALGAIGSAHAEPWNKDNNPNFFNAVANSPMRMDFDSLPLVGKLKDDRLAWSETFWPANLGGVAFRWNSATPQPFTFKLKTKEELLRMSEAELSELSPAELYDISQGNYNYPLTKKVLKANKPDDLWWEGICHGWALAAAHYPEPAAVLITNKDGIKVPFGSSDVKGLLALHDAHNSKGTYARVGERCGENGKVDGEAFPEDGVVPQITQRQANKAECADVNAGAFHIIITNMIGINSQSFVADVDRYNDVWNQPIFGYKTEIVGNVALSAQDIRNGVAQKIQVKNDMSYGDELEFYSKELEDEGIIEFVSKLPVTGTPHQLYSTRNYEYVLELDARGSIIGGTWISETRPDMIWMKKKDQRFMNGKYNLEGLNRIYRPVSR
jgi:hypothetical protein